MSWPKGFLPSGGLTDEKCRVCGWSGPGRDGNCINCQAPWTGPLTCDTCGTALKGRNAIGRFCKIRFRLCGACEGERRMADTFVRATEYAVRRMRAA